MRKLWGSWNELGEMDPVSAKSRVVDFVHHVPGYRQDTDPRPDSILGQWAAWLWGEEAETKIEPSCTSTDAQAETAELGDWSQASVHSYC